MELNLICVKDCENVTNGILFKYRRDVWYTYTYNSYLKENPGIIRQGSSFNGRIGKKFMDENFITENDFIIYHNNFMKLFDI